MPKVASSASEAQYQRWRGTVHFSVDPAAEANAQVVDLKLAPRNAKGRVEFSADLEILAPADLAKSNGAVFYEVNNRGNPICLGQLNGGGDDFLFRQGFMVAWSGWIAETLPGGNRLRLTTPVATDEGRPIRGVVRSRDGAEQPGGAFAHCPMGQSRQLSAHRARRRRRDVDLAPARKGPRALLSLVRNGGSSSVRSTTKAIMANCRSSNSRCRAAFSRATSTN